VDAKYAIVLASRDRPIQRAKTAVQIVRQQRAARDDALGTFVVEQEA
jgi:hypothetical protein